jgi:glycine/D-amino acid oxidase-like deaminating enzyme
MPIDENTLKVGSNYEWNDLTENPTEKTKDALLEKALSIVDLDFAMKDHKAGIRPTVKDRRPLLGKHPDHPNLVVFNGLGTKGVSLAPYMANHLIDHIMDNQDLMKEVDIKRFQSS